MALLLLTVLFDDELAIELRQLAWRTVPAVSLTAAIVYPWTLPQLSVGSLAIYLALLLATSAALWHKQRQPPLLAAGAITFIANGLAHVRPLYLLLGKSALAAGLPWLAAGLAIVLVAVGISLAKMGLWQSARHWLWRVNVVLGGAGKEAH